MPLRRTDLVGVMLLVLGGVCGTWGWWSTTRNIRPVDIPISMAIGHVRTTEFTPDVNAPYIISIEVQKTIPFEALNCLLGTAMPNPRSSALGECPDQPSVVRASWVLTSDGKTIARGSSDDHRAGGWGNESISRDLGAFDGERGRRYVLDVNVLADGSSLAVGNPRLIVAVTPALYVDYSLRDAIIFLVAGVLVVVGIASLIVSQRSRRGRSSHA